MKLDVKLDTFKMQRTSESVRQAFDKGMDDFIDFVGERSTAMLDSGIYHGIGNLKRSQDIIYKFLHKILKYHAPYAAFVEYGTGIFSDHPKATREPIRPNKKETLAWVSRGSRPASDDVEGWTMAREQGRAIYAKVVRGMKPRPFLRPAWDEGKQKLHEFVRNHFKRIRNQ